MKCGCWDEYVAGHIRKDKILNDHIQEWVEVAHINEKIIENLLRWSYMYPKKVNKCVGEEGGLNNLESN